MCILMNSRIHQTELPSSCLFTASNRSELLFEYEKIRLRLAGVTEHQVGDELRRFDAMWSELFPVEQARIVQLLVERVDLSEKGADITLRTEGLAGLIQDLHAVSGQRKDAA